MYRESEGFQWIKKHFFYLGKKVYFLYGNEGNKFFPEIILLFFPSLRGKNVHELASEQSFVHFITMHDMLRYEFNNFIITPFGDGGFKTIIWVK